MEKPLKNILIKNSTTIIDEFKKAGFEFYQKNEKIHLFSFKHFLIVTLSNIEASYKTKYKQIHTPSPEYVLFYKRRGTNIFKNKDQAPKGSINFSLEQEYYDLYYRLMHTFYINNQQNYSNYSSSIFFEEIVRYIQQNQLQFFDF